MSKKTKDNLCLICGLRIPRDKHWACDHCEKTMKAEDFNQYLIDHLDQISDLTNNLKE